MQQKKKIPTNILGKRKQITVKKAIKGKINLRKQNEGICPNLVHSFDASNISILIKQLLKNKKNINILTIHDCFASSANNIELMNLHVKLAFVFLYLNKNFVINYNKVIIDHIEKVGYILNKEENYVCINNKKIFLPKVPSFKNNDLIKENILGSKYFIN